ncbi:MAG TPA: tetratricopeptide repeat protein [Verrucomicrobiae bacterium]|nr:tetratricopeptide repeat protein [Verrucomicrobiae bacterium]
MSRFSNLEFRDDSEEQSASTPLVKDEVYYQQEAQTTFESGDFEQALRSYAKVLEYNPQNTVAWAGQVKMLIELGEFREARLWADKALERFPHDPELLAAKGVALARLGDIDNAMAFSDAAIEERGDTPYVWLARGDVLLAAKQKQAVSCIEQAVVRSCNSFVHWLASRIYYYYGKFSLALKMAKDGIALDASRSALWLQLGYCQVALGLASVAKNSFDQALQLNPQCHAAVVASAKLGGDGLLRRFFRRCRGALQR